MIFEEARIEHHQTRKIKKILVLQEKYHNISCLKKDP
ncbi:MAG: hypothetical protein ACJAW3_000520 [Lentimonas sp.]|jgi:hypothetical protein